MLLRDGAGTHIVIGLIAFAAGRGGDPAKYIFDISEGPVTVVDGITLGAGRRLTITGAGQVTVIGSPPEKRHEGAI